MKEDFTNFFFDSFAPGKIILSGEHSVVYKKPALSFAVNKKTKVTFTIKFSTQTEVSQSNPFTIHLKDLNSQVYANKKDFLCFINDSLLHQHLIINLIFTHFKLIYQKLFNDKYKQILLNFINKIDLLNITIQSDIPLGFGLGSSGALNVAIVNAINFIIKKIYHVDGLTEQDIIFISNKGEELFHATPSGNDVTLSFKGGVICFHSLSCYREIKSKEYLDHFRIFLIDTKVTRNCKEFIEKVSQFKKEHLDDFNRCINNIGDITNNLIGILENNENNFDKFFNLIKENQHYLKNINVSIKIIDEIVQFCEEKGFSAKITGAGGGGYVLVLALKKDADNFINAIREKYEYTEVHLSNNGAYIEQL